MALTHVCIWDPKIGYRRVTLKEACELHPYGAKARSGCFVCELCAQNVLLTAPGVNIQHFRHDPSSPNKECDERQAYFDPTYGRALRGLNSHVMPLRLNVTGATFQLQLGFFYPPDRTAHCDRIKIAGDSHQTYEYSFERIEKMGTTYLDVGTIPSKVYGIDYINANNALTRYWSSKVTGVSSTGSFFDGRTGHILLSGSKAYASNSYYLLQKRKIYSHSKELQIEEVCQVRSVDFSIWYLYKVQVKKFSAQAAKFFLGYSIFLTEKPTKFYPIWPAYIRAPHFIYHNSSSFYFYLCGDDAELKAYPASSSVLNTEDGKLYKLYTREREQLISLGKSGALGFSYLIKQPLNKTVSLPKVTIRDQAENDLNEDTYFKLPKSKYISVSSLYDGKAIIRRKQKIESIRRICAEHDLIIDNLSLGTEISFYHGCDCVRSIRFESDSQNVNLQLADENLVKKLERCSGTMISIPHSFGTIASKFDDYPKTRQWIRSVIRRGEISRAAYRILIKNQFQRMTGLANGGENAIKNTKY